MRNCGVDRNNWWYSLLCKGLRGFYPRESRGNPPKASLETYCLGERMRIRNITRSVIRPWDTTVLPPLREIAAVAALFAVSLLAFAG